MALSKKEVEATILAKGFQPVEISGYKNLSSSLEVRCSRGHTFFTDMKSVRSDKFKCPLCVGEDVSSLSETKCVLPPKTGFRIIAVDQASQKIGISVYDEGKLVYYHYVEVSGVLSVRLQKIYKFMSDLVIKQWQPNYLVFEDIQYQDNALTHKTLGMVMGVVILAAEQAQIEHTEILNKVWQSEFSIGGANRVAQKANVIKRVKEYYKIDVTDDIADAILLGQYATKKLSHRWEKILF
jgi:Holliday junction resolvasome RuvABC endonuclease subunit